VSFRFLHTADWQAGKPFGNVPGDAGAALRRQRIDTIATVARLATEQRVDAVLVAGDAFDSNEVEDRTINQVLAALTPFEAPGSSCPGITMRLSRTACGHACGDCMPQLTSSSPTSPSRSSCNREGQ